VAKTTCSLSTVLFDANDSASQRNENKFDWSTATWAQATLYTAPTAAPGPLPLFGAAAAFGFSRKLRKRIQGARLPIGSSQPLA
jgi:hypothetical protein